ncbi:MAG TPA: tetratricopeptide repeat protein [Candidatus Acidoferrales bacterium]|nr:tetratricopeptide repeat protein [Candidatus Acidoferrales bacterium]
MRSIVVLATAVCCLVSVPGFADARTSRQGATSQAPPQSSAKTPETPSDNAAASSTGLEHAKSLIQKGQLTQAETTTRQFLDGHADSADGHFLLGYILFDELHEKYVGEEKKEGDSFRYNDNVGGELAKMRDAKARESLAEFSAGARYRAASAFDLKIVALDYVLLKDNPSADKWLTVSLRLDPKDAQGWFYLGRTKYSETEYAAAIEAFEQCLKLEPRNILAEYNVGLSYEGLNQKNEAIQAYQNAIDWQAQSEIKSPEPFVYLARLYLNQNQPEKAVPYLVRAVVAFPQVSLAHEELGRAYSVLHRLSEAQEELEKAVKLSPEKASLRCVLGQVYQRQGMTAQAQTEFDRCSALQNTQSSYPKGPE